MKSPVDDQAVGEGAVDRRAHRGEVEIALGLGERGLQFRKLRAGLRLLRLGDFDIVARGVIGRLRRLHRRHALIAAGFGHFEGRARGKSLGAQRLLAVVIETGALQAGFRGNELRAGLLDRAFQRGDLAADAVDGGLLGRDLGARGIDRDAIIAVVDPEDHVAGPHHHVVAGKDGRDVARDPRAERGVVGADIGVVGGDEKASDQKIMHAIARGGEREQRADADQDQFALAGFRRRGTGSTPARRPARRWPAGPAPAVRRATVSSARCGTKRFERSRGGLAPTASSAVSGSARTMRAAWSLAAAITASPFKVAMPAQPKTGLASRQPKN